MTDTSLPAATPETPIRSPELSGRILVIGLLLVGIAATGMMFVYWEQHTRPFRPLREAIGREFKHSRPNVEGGRVKGRGPWTLRISLSVDFPSTEDTEQADRVANRILEIIRSQPPIPQLEKLDINLIQFVPQELAKTKTFSYTPTEVFDGGQPQSDK